MKFFASLIVFGLALGAAGLAIGLLSRAGARERQEDVMLRLRAMGGTDKDALVAAPGDSRIANPLVRWTCHWLWRSGAEVEPPAVARALLILGLLLPVALVLFDWITGFLVLAGLIGIGYAYLVQQAARRRGEILGQLPGYLESVIRILSAGNTLEESLASAAREAAEPSRSLFLSVGRQVRLGASVEETLNETGDIHRLRDLKVLALAAAINRKYGGSLRNILKSLMAAIRGRDVAARELRALTAETRFSAVVLSVIPVGLSGYIWLQNRAYYADMWAQPGGRFALIFAVALQLMGMVVIWRMMRSTSEGDE